MVWLYDDTVAGPWLVQTFRSLPLPLLVLWHAFDTISRETTDQAAAEGAGWWTTLCRIALPARRAALAVAWLALDQPGLALQAAQHVRDLAPYRESAHTRVMESHLAAGNRTEVVKAFDELRNMLVETMGLEPGPESDELFQRALG